MRKEQYLSIEDSKSSSSETVFIRFSDIENVDTWDEDLTESEWKPSRTVYFLTVFGSVLDIVDFCFAPIAVVFFLVQVFAFPDTSQIFYVTVLFSMIYTYSIAAKYVLAWYDYQFWVQNNTVVSALVDPELFLYYTLKFGYGRYTFLMCVLERRKLTGNHVDFVYSNSKNLARMVLVDTPEIVSLVTLGIYLYSPNVLQNIELVWAIYELIMLGPQYLKSIIAVIMYPFVAQNIKRDNGESIKNHYFKQLNETVLELLDDHERQKQRQADESKTTQKGREDEHTSSTKHSEESESTLHE